MTPAARHAAAIEVLDVWLAGAPLEKALLNWSRGSRFAGSKDRAAVRDLCFQSARCRDSYAIFDGGMSGRALVMGHVVCNGGIAPVADWQDRLHAIFCGEGYAPKALESSVIQKVSDAISTESAFIPDVPDWLASRLRDDLGRSFEPVMNVQKSRSEVFLRVNRSRATLAEAQSSLGGDGIETIKSPAADMALKVTANPRRIAQSNAYLSGLVDLQDASAQAACEMIEVAGTARVLDLCAGGGGKSLALSDRTSAHVFAHDLASERMSDLPVRAGRAGLSVEIIPTDALKKAAPFDVILCDVPCSGSGTWRRTPDSKWRLTETRLRELLITQAAILDQAAGLLGPYGRLVYMTCSILDAENKSQIQEFMRRSEGFSLDGCQDFLPGPEGDGFFVATLNKTT